MVEDFPMMTREAFDRLVLLADRSGERFGGEAALDPVAALEGFARERPDHPAVVSAGGVWSHRALHELGLRLAVRLDALLEGRRAAVAACGPVGIVQFATLLACLRLGVPMVPLDTQRSALRNRQATMLSRAGAAVCVGATDDARPHVGPGVPVLCLDELGDDVPADGFDRGVEDDPALLIFTSGSTGVPKAVIKTRHSLLEAIRIRRHVLDVTGSDVCAFAGSSSVSGCHLNCWTALATGATVVVMDATANVTDVLAFYERHEVTVSTLYIGLARLLVQHPEARRRLGTLRAATMFGDVVQWDDVVRMRAALDEAALLFCSFGSTEASWSLGWTVPGGTIAGTGQVPLGVCLPGAAVWLDPAADGGEGGELVVASARIAAGYLDDPAKTAARFFLHPDGSGRVIFRTGDMVRRRADGMLEFLGRGDNQIKLRGWRIELEEIETAARAAPGVVAACVVPRRKERGPVEALALYVAWADGATGSADAVLEALRKTLPRAMWPAEIVALRTLPMTRSAKVDRARVAELDLQRREARRSGGEGARAASPGDGIEQRVGACIVGELGLSAYQANRRFTDIGGDSLQALGCALAIEQQFGVTIDPEAFLADVPLSDLVAGIARLARQAGTDLSGS